MKTKEQILLDSIWELGRLQKQIIPGINCMRMAYQVCNNQLQLLCKTLGFTVIMMKCMHNLYQPQTQANLT